MREPVQLQRAKADRGFLEVLRAVSSLDHLDDRGAWQEPATILPVQPSRPAVPTVMPLGGSRRDR